MFLSQDVFEPILIAQFFPGLDPQILLWAAILTPIVLLLALGVTSIVAFDIAKTIVSTISDIFQQIIKLLKPPSWDTWQALIWISIFSWLVSLLPQNPVFQSLIASVGWLFLIPGVHWFMHVEKLDLGGGTEVNVKKGLTVNNFYLAPWITGALVCLFLFTGLTGGGLVHLAFILWPPISVLIASLPDFIRPDLLQLISNFKLPENPSFCQKLILWLAPYSMQEDLLQFGYTFQVPQKPEVRQKLILWLLSNLVLSCWLQLCFSTQAWLKDYPSLLSGDVSRSAFVVKLDASKPSPRGASILEQAGNMIEEELRGRSWAWVERWLLNLDQEIKEIEDIIMSQISQVEENRFWKLEARTAAGTEYTLRLFSVWQGPTVDGTGYYLTKDCYITKTPGTRVPVSAQAKPAASRGLAKVECNTTDGPFIGQPNLSEVRIETDGKRGSW